MNDFKSFLQQNPWSPSMLAQMLQNECSQIAASNAHGVQLVISASMITMAKYFDDRLETYHHWVQENSAAACNELNAASQHR